MSDFLSNYYKTIDVEKELQKILPADEKTIDTEKVENQDLSIIEQSLDPLLTASNRFVGSGVQILDLPFMLLDAIDTGKDEAICGDCKHRGIVLSLDDATI